MEYWFFVLCLMIGIGIAIGIAVGMTLAHKKPDGTLHVDQRDPRTDKYDLAFDTNLDDVPKKKYVLFAVEVIKSRENFPL